MATNFCPNCGANIDTPVRFCRRCGEQLVNSGASMNPSEVTTRTLDQPSPPSDPSTMVVNSGLTAPAYIPPDQFGGATQRGLQAPQSSGHNRLLILAVVFLIVLTSLAILVPPIAHRVSVAMRGRPHDAATQPPPDTGGASSAPLSPELEALRYPGSKRTMQVEDEPGKEVLGFQSSDSVDKVTAWYVARLHPTKVIQLPLGSVLKNADATVVLTGIGGVTNIVVTRGEDD
jgi:hypothetical protein